MKDYKKILVISGDFYHKTEVNRTGFDKLKESVNDLTVDYWEPEVDREFLFSRETLQQYDAVCVARMGIFDPNNSKSSWLTGEFEQILFDHVSEGGQLIVLHAGTAMYENNETFLSLTGGKFISHPPETTPVHYVSAENPIAPDIPDSSEPDEFYQIDLFADDAVLLAHAERDGKRVPAAWIRKENRGSVLSLTPGHFNSALTCPFTQSLLANFLEGRIQL